MISKIVILLCLIAASRQEPQVVAGLPYVANYASSYDAHTINHDIRAPIVTPLVEAAPFTSIIQQNVYRSPIASYSVTPIAQYTSPIVPATPIEPALRLNAAPKPEEPQSSRSTQLPQQDQNSVRVPNAVFLASQFLSRNNPENDQNQQSARLSNPEPRNEQNRDDNQRNAGVLAATPKGFGFIQRPNARFLQIQRDGNVASRSRPINGEQQEKLGQNAKLIRENEDAESVEVNNPNLQNSEPGKASVAAPVVPAGLALAPNVNFLPSYYTGVVTF